MADAFDLVIHAPRAVCDGAEAARTIGIADGRIVAVEPAGSLPPASRVVELGPDAVLLPGLVDSHVHICEPGNTEWEGFATATRAAAAGGITTLVDMPLDSVPTTVSTDALHTKRAAADGRCHVDVGFWAGAVPGNLGQLAPLHEAGVLGFKCFLADSGTDDFPPVNAGQMEQALSVLRGFGTPLLVHAESAEAAAAIGEASGRRYADYLASRPRGVENLAVAQVIEAARRTGGHAHIVHLSSSDALPMIASARREGVPVTAETCPHYLALTAEEIADGATACKCSPPIREAANRELLWDGLRDGVLDLVVSDHSPSTAAMKELGSGDFGAAWGGISSLQLGLPVVWTQARHRGFTLGDVAVWMAERPARLAGLSGKGRIAPGYDADFCVFAPDESFTVDPARL
ncbi:MAG TPA: allantoinase AllB, partial [Streptosporangiaceae bacterium]|nr:allantoinase AllB [Streptosporangiaceae bacterium]